jgi:HSP20 family protein
MTLVRWRPTRDLLSFQRDMSRMLNDFFAEPPPVADAFERDWVPAVDIFEKNDEVNLVAELPGLTKEDVDISIENGTLTISGEKKRESEVKDDNFHRVERAYGRFQRSFALPSAIDPKKVKAVFKDGILTVNLGKKEEAKPKKVEIEVS